MTADNSIGGHIVQCSAIAKSGNRCLLRGTWKSGLCKAHDPSRIDEIISERRRGNERQRLYYISGIRARNNFLPDQDVQYFMALIRACIEEPSEIDSAFIWLIEKLLMGRISKKLYNRFKRLIIKRERKSYAGKSYIPAAVLKKDKHAYDEYRRKQRERKSTPEYKEKVRRHASSPEFRQRRMELEKRRRDKLFLCPDKLEAKREKQRNIMNLRNADRRNSEAFFSSIALASLPQKIEAAK